MSLTATVREPALLGGLRLEEVPASEWEELDACSVCDTAGLVDVAAVDGAAPGPVLAVCTRCEHAVIRRRPTQAWFEDFYATDWDRRGRRRRDSTARAADSKVLRFCAAEMKEASAVLEVGVGFGAQLRAFADAGHDVMGIERSEHRATYVREVMGLPCERSAVEAAGGGRLFDLVYSHHVLEHVGDPASVIKQAATRLRERGLLYIAVPDLFAEYAPQTFHFVPHLNAFTRRSLTELLARHGFAVLRIDIDREIQVLARLDRAAVGPDGSMDPTFLDRVATWACGPFGALSQSRTLVWRKARTPEANYTIETLDRDGGRRIRAATLVQQLPGPVRRMASQLSDPTLRMLRVDVAGDPGLPIRVVHPGRSGPVWIK